METIFTTMRWIVFLLWKSSTILWECALWNQLDEGQPLPPNASRVLMTSFYADVRSHHIEDDDISLMAFLFPQWSSLQSCSVTWEQAWALGLEEVHPQPRCRARWGAPCQSCNASHPPFEGQPLWRSSLAFIQGGKDNLFIYLYIKPTSSEIHSFHPSHPT